MDQTGACVKVVGVGGGGSNAVNRMIEVGVQGVEFIVMNTDGHALERSLAPTRLQLGAHLTRGLGAGGDPEKGQRAAEESRQEIKRLLGEAEMVFITAGMGGGTGTGAAPVVAHIARDLGALAVGVVTRPFENEGPRRARVAHEGLRQLREKVDALITIPNERLRALAGGRLPMMEAFRMADDILRQGVQGISDIINITGDWNVDFADVRTIMSDAGPALMGIGTAVGKARAVDATNAAISSPLLETSIQGAQRVLVNITAPDDFVMEEWDEVTSLIRGYTDVEEANIITGLVFCDDPQGVVKVTVVAAGFGLGGGRPLPRVAPKEAARTEPAAVPAMASVPAAALAPTQPAAPEAPPPPSAPNPRPAPPAGSKRPGDVPRPDDIDVPAFLRTKK